MQNPHLNKIATLSPLKRRRLNVAPLAVTASPTYGKVKPPNQEIRAVGQSFLPGLVRGKQFPRYAL